MICEACRCIQVDIRPTQFGNRFPVDVAIEGTVADFLAAISKKGIIRGHNGFVESCRQVISIAGDGAFAMVMQDFMTAVKYNLPFVQFVLNNQKLAFIEYEQQSAGQRNYVIDLQDADYCKMAEAMGGVAYTVRTPDELEALMPMLADVKAPTLVNVYVADDAPLPGKIVMEEAQGYAKFLLNTILKDGKIPEMPPMKEVLRQFF